MLTKKIDGSLSHQVYHKKTHTDRYLHAESHPHPSQKGGILNTLATRAVRISDTEHLKEELAHLSRVLQENGYKIKDIKRAFKKAQKPRIKNREDQRRKAFLPYIQGTIDKIAKVLKQKQIKTSFSPPNSLRNLLDKSKDPIDPKLRKGIYAIPCSCGEIYIGETSQAINIRIKEHCVDIRHERIKKSAIAENSQKTNHHICIEDTKVIEIEENYNRRHVQEAIEIEKHEKNFNRDNRLILSET